MKEIMRNNVIIYLISTLIIFIMTFMLSTRKYNNIANNYGKVDKIKKNKNKTNKALFISRDGVLNIGKGYTYKVGNLELFGDTSEVICEFTKMGYIIIVITNQSGIAKGMYKEKQMRKFNKELVKQLKTKGARIDAIYYCPHLEESNCLCMKPRTGMIDRAQLEFNIDLDNSILIGDKMTDILTGINSGISKNIMVTTGIYEKDDYKTEELYWSTQPITVNNLTEALEYIKSKINEQNKPKNRR